ncbi:MAG: 6,7-dimethyl-8-ribityllumazine synthase [Polyangiaceae bacterium]|nr:6,7-dimethyl-8-ribityllumazine synthase [Polyangiaceae bacterium]
MSEVLPELLEGQLIVPAGARFAIVGARFNELVVDRLVEGAVGALKRHGVSSDAITTVRVPGAWELSPVCARLAKSGRFHAVIACGAVIRGATAHFDYVCGEAARGVAAATADTGVPVIFGVLTTDTIEQCLERAGTKAGNKGYEAALAAIEMVSLGQQMTDLGL